ncbi:hypothetical protein PHYSODRAFT_524249 [Phytophthora sojae]|uniref:Uncharacterized protein n=1 Tax=Phytophthora sojae (strain P6497) TaxID=1094619 RepID=G5A6C6_PHYSP|nr:hypothetical protein PHYSODRAFT_524249 [Phytophthora sojae]EGZ08881.1 hypothetical protein PHYSODRAFT_524249 [Phytophthora sojae]|eukprot:XP_009535514.1 hypothetical protein PHYSODRAFT_524249 [Phytophthora sojae]
MAAVDVASSPLLALNSQSHVLVGNEYAEVATIEQLPRGTALHAARTALIKESAARAAPSSKQSTGNGIEVKLPLRKAPSAADLARRAARRVNVWKKSEQERRGEEERARQVKHEQEKKRQNHVAHAKQRRRAEIYALNALLRQLQQEKVAKYIAAQKELQELQQQQQQDRCKDGENLTETTAALSQVRAVGV